MYSYVPLLSNNVDKDWFGIRFVFRGVFNSIYEYVFYMIYEYYRIYVDYIYMVYWFCAIYEIYGFYWILHDL